MSMMMSDCAPSERALSVATASDHQNNLTDLENETNQNETNQNELENEKTEALKFLINVIKSRNLPSPRTELAPWWVVPTDFLKNLLENDEVSFFNLEDFLMETSNGRRFLSEIIIDDCTVLNSKDILMKNFTLVSSEVWEFVLKIQEIYPERFKTDVVKGIPRRVEKIQQRGSKREYTRNE
jgi:hypothetical protein